MKILLSIIFSSICFVHLVLAFNSPNDYKLELVQVLFRHGDRTPDKSEIYETDPYDEIFKSHGYGQLTKIGLQREYKIGQLLRERYGNFLGDFKNSDVYAYSTPYDRTKMSLQLVLAGLYPPSSKTSWNNEVNWLPIPTHCDPIETNFLMGFSCPVYLKLFKQTLQLSEIREKFEKYQNFYKSFNNKTGITTHTPTTVYMIYCNIRAAESLGLPRPDWCNDEDFENMKEISAIGLHRVMTYTETMKRIMGGVIIEEFLKNLKNRDEKKIYLYGGHGLNVVAFTNVHNFTGIPDLPDYGSTIIFEKLRGKDNQSYIRMYLWTGVSEKLIPLKLDNCEEICLLSNYMNIVKTLLPDKIARQCTSRRNLCKRRSTAHKMDLSLQLSYLFAGKDLSSFKYMKDFIVPSST